jgi:hypothetical protein
MTKSEARDRFFTETKGLNEDQLEAIADTTSALLGSTFIVRGVKSDDTAFYTLSNYYTAIEAYLAMCDVELDKSQDVYFIKTKVDSNRYHLYKLDTILLLILREIDFDILKKANISESHSTTVGEILSRLSRTEIYPSKAISNLRTDFTNAMMRLRHYKIVDFQQTEIKNDTAIVVIYPTIAILVQSDSVENLAKQLNEYKATDEVAGGETDEDSSED